MAVAPEERPRESRACSDYSSTNVPPSLLSSHRANQHDSSLLSDSVEIEPGSRMKASVHHNSFQTDHACASINCHPAGPGRATKASIHHLQALVAKHLSVLFRHPDTHKVPKATRTSSSSCRHSHHCPIQRHAGSSNTAIHRPTIRRAATVQTSSDRSAMPCDFSAPTLPYYAQAASTLPPPAGSSRVLWMVTMIQGSAVGSSQCHEGWLARTEYVLGEEMTRRAQSLRQRGQRRRCRDTKRRKRGRRLSLVT